MIFDVDGLIGEILVTAMKRKSPTYNWWKEVVAVWQRKQDGLQFCLFRDGLARFRHGDSEPFVESDGCDYLSFEAAVQWALDHSFKRVQDFA